MFLSFKLNELIDSKNVVHLKWYYPESDEDRYEVGQDHAFMVNVPFQFIGNKKKYEKRWWLDLMHWYFNKKRYKSPLKSNSS